MQNKRYLTDGAARPLAPGAALMLWPGDEAIPRRGGPDWRALLAALRRRRKLALYTFAGVLAASLLLALLSPPVYRATATLQANTSAGFEGARRDLPALADMMGSEQARSLKTQVAILKGPQTEKRAVKSLPPAMRQAVENYSVISIEAEGDTDLITVSASTRDARTSVALANAVCRQYIQLSLEKNRGQLQSATNYVADQMKTAGEKLNRARAALKQYKQQSQTFDITAQSQNLIEDMGRIEAGWREARAEKEAGQAQLERLQSTADALPEVEVVPGTIVRRPAVEAMKTQLTRLELERIAALREYQPASSEVRNLDEQISAIRSRLRNEAQTEISSWQKRANPVRLSLIQDIARLRGQVWAAEARGVALKAALMKAKAEMARLPEREQRLSQMTMNLNSLQQTYQMLDEKYQTLRMSQGARVANASLLFPAEMPEGPVGRSAARVLLTGLLAGLALALALAALVDWLDDRVYSDGDAEGATQLPVLAHVPLIEGAGARHLSGDMSDPPALLESYRMLRTGIAFAADGEPPRSLAVTSSRLQEGKSLTSANLAVVMAMAGKRVIVVDCDLRRPSLHQVFNLPNDTGFTSVVNGDTPLLSALRETGTPRLRVLTSGPIPENPTELLDSPPGRDCLRQIVEMADCVIIDSPPVLGLADARILASVADATLLVVAGGQAAKQQIAQTRDLLAQSDGNLIGVVINKVLPEENSYYSYYQDPYSSGGGDGGAHPNGSFAPDKIVNAAKGLLAATRDPRGG